MNTGFMTEGICPDNCLIRLHDETRHLTDETAGFINLGRIDTGDQIKEIAAGFYCHHDFLERGIAGSFPDAVNGAFHLPGAVFNRLQTIGSCHPQIIMTMDANNRLFDTGDILKDTRNQVSELIGNSVADGIRHINRRRTAFDDLFDYLIQICRFSAAGIHR